jgi:cell wall-associated NlpC family hydrolase
MTSSRRPCRLLLAIAVLFLTGLVLACGTAGISAGSSPRWACPSPTPLPYGPSGPVKEHRALPTATPVGPQEYEDTYYAEWEREYGVGGTLLNGSPALSGPPFPSPTPYALVGTTFVLGQRVEVWPLHVLVEARGGPLVEQPGIPISSQRLYFVDITWTNHSAEQIPIDYAERVRLRAVTAPSGAILTDSTWGLSDLSRDLAGLTEPLPSSIPPGESHVSVPIVAPAGEVKTVDVVFAEQPGYSPLLPTPTSEAGQPTPTPQPSPTATTTPTPNADLRNPAPTFLTVQWTRAQLRVGPGCDDPGALSDWGNGPGVAWGHEPPIGIAAPPGANRVVQIALNQVGKQYVWGAKGPETFDCSGLMTWSYARIGISIPQGTAGQWPRMRPVSGAEVQPGDLIFFTVETPSQIDHVGMLVGDLDGDGTWDMVHASAPCCGVRVEYDILHRAFWQGKIAGFRTAR